MPALRELQAAMRQALLDGEERVLARAVEPDGLAPQARVAVYRHHVFTSLTAALEATYPVVRRLVDPRFFAFAAHAFVAARPPAGPCLTEYGADLAEFLASFPPCRELPWLPDVARLEWALGRAADAEDAVPVDPAALSDLDPMAAAAVVLRLAPSVTLLESRWPVDEVWRANQPGADPDRVVDLGAGPVALEIRRLGEDVVFRRLAPPVFTLRRALVEGRTLGEAVTAALGVDPGLDLVRALGDLLAEDLVTGFVVSHERRPEPEQGVSA